MTFRILTVCSGNICRSPMAEQLLRARLGGVDDIEVSSAGTIAMVGDGMPAEARELSARLGAADADAHRARQLDERMVREADLVLGLAREHRRAVVELVPAATRKTFTLREFAHLAAEVTEADLAASVDPFADAPPGGLGVAVTATASLRGVVAPFESPDDADVVDPYRRSAAVYEQSAQQIGPAVDVTVALLARLAARR
ncbi:arsenate reductase/protein-tyrosine-phosphatase family protein [Agromyces bracchium]|uniref:Low molecular weight phosphatase family protein n=1 Tax=Agromyces bracchium TaxID=88376 RepID=A0A6I3M8P2_9MICO|nr:low molecular weight phosphatase family protein [Agromyces bracchium]MTH69595.1 low molecular weight phosphatase family protein [Agromyces bracchium]